MVNLKEETMRCCLQYEETEVKDGIDQIRFSFPQEEEFKKEEEARGEEVKEGMMIEILWPLANTYFPCKIISFTPLLKSTQGGSNKKRKDTVDNIDTKENSGSKIIKSSSIPNKKKHKSNKIELEIYELDEQAIDDKEKVPDPEELPKDSVAAPTQKSDTQFDAARVAALGWRHSLVFFDVQAKAKTKARLKSNNGRSYLFNILLIITQ